MKRFFLLLVCVVIVGKAMGQGDFCSAVTTIINDGPNKFRNTRGNTISANQNATLWECGIPVPGTIKSRFVASLGLFYEGAFLQTADNQQIQPMYDSCKALLDACLLPKGYELTRNANYYSGLDSFKKLVYMPPAAADAVPLKAPPHVTLEVAYNKDAGVYTIVMYIFEH